jgi:hypothetical protein
VGKPRLNLITAMLSFPSLQRFVVATLGLNDFNAVWVLVNLNGASAMNAFLSHWRALTTGGVRVKNVDHVFQAAAILRQKIAQWVSNSISYFRPSSF